MIRFIDISNWQKGLELSRLSPSPDAVVCKATEGLWFVDPCCDAFIQEAVAMGKPFGFYHFADARNNATFEADYFMDNCEGYFGYGIPILDWEYIYDENGNVVSNPSVAWVNEFVNRVHDVKGVWPWIYANPWRFDQGGVEPNCMRWVAEYPPYESPSWLDAESWACPEADGFVGAWQFCSDGVLDGYAGYLDLDLFYGDREAWYRYAGCDSADSGDNSVTMLENDEYKVTIERKQ